MSHWAVENYDEHFSLFLTFQGINYYLIMKIIVAALVQLMTNQSFSMTYYQRLLSNNVKKLKEQEIKILSTR